MRLLNFIKEAFRAIVEVVDEKIDAIQDEKITRKLDDRAAQSDAKNWRTSVVDLMKLAGLDPSLPNRRELAKELGHKGSFTGSTDENIWLRSKLFDALAEGDIRLPRPT